MGLRRMEEGDELDARCVYHKFCAAVPSLPAYYPDFWQLLSTHYPHNKRCSCQSDPVWIEWLAFCSSTHYPPALSTFKPWANVAQLILSGSLAGTINLSSHSTMNPLRTAMIFKWRPIRLLRRVSISAVNRTKDASPRSSVVCDPFTIIPSYLSYCKETNFRPQSE